MVNNASEQLDIVFAALSDPTRRTILERLSHAEYSVTEIAAPFNMSLPAISKHLTILENAGLITRRREGRMHHLRLAAAPMRNAIEWLEDYRQFWEAQFDNLDAYLNSEPGPAVDHAE